MLRNEPDDSTLALAAGAGDRAALELLLDRHADLVHAVCRRIVGNPDDALDATQEALIAVARGITRFDGRARFTTWLYRVATNAALDEVRRRKRRPIPHETLPEDAGARAGTAAGVGGGRAPGTDAVDARLAVDAALAGLPEDFRVAVVLRDLCDLDYAEIAEMLDLAPGTVRSRISRGRAALAEALGNPAPVSERPSEQP